jgi:NitT/TauT family transport system substrate-binding protein
MRLGHFPTNSSKEVTMHHRLRHHSPRAVAVALVALVALAACVTATAARDARNLTTVKVGGIASTLYLPFYVADANGYFAKRGIQIEYNTIANATPLISGDVNLQLSGFDTAIINAGAGKPTPIIAVLQKRNSLGLFVRADKAVSGKYPHNVAQMRGFTVGTTNRNSGAEPFLQSTFSQAGLTEGKDYTITPLVNGPNLMAALQAKRIDAAMLFPPFDTQAVTSGLVKPVVSQSAANGPADISQLYGATVLANRDWVAQNPALVRGVANALNEALAFTRNYTANKDALIAIAQKYTGITDTAALQVGLAGVSALAVNGMNCMRAGVQVRLDNKYNLVGSLPGCDQLRNPKLVPFEPLKKTPAKKTPPKKKK